MKNRRFLMLFLFFIPLLILMFQISGCNRNDQSTLTYTGIVEAKQLDMSTEISGKVEKISVVEGALVVPDQLIMTLDATDFKIKREIAIEALEVAKLKAADLENGNSQNMIRQARANVEAAHAQVEKAKFELDYLQSGYEDLKALEERGAVSLSEVEKASHALDLASSGFKQIQNQEIALNAVLKETINSISNEKLKIAEHEINLRMLDLQSVDQIIEKCQVLSPGQAMVETINYEVGEYVAPGQRLVTLVDLSHIWMKIYIPEKELYRVGINMPVDFIDTFLADSGVTGKIVFISSQAEFTPKNIESRENKQEMVYEVHIEVSDPSEIIKPGMFLDVTLREGDQ